MLPQFLFASGPSAENALISSYVRQACEALSFKGRAGSVLAVTSRPHSVYATLSESLSVRECECVLQARKPFAETHFGRAYMAIREFILDDRHDPRALMVLRHLLFWLLSAAAKTDASVVAIELFL